MADLAWQIPLQAGQNIPNFGPDPNAMLAFLKVQQQRQQNTGYNAMAELYRDPANLQNGMLKPEAIAKAIAGGQMSPQIGLDTMGKQAEIGQRQTQTNLAAAKTRDDNRSWMVETVAAPAVSKYEEVLKSTGNAEQAQRAAQEVYSEGLTTARSDGRLTPQESAGMASNFDYNRARTNVLGLKGISDIEHQRRQEGREDQRLSYEAQRTNIEGARAVDQHRQAERGARDAPENYEVSDGKGGTTVKPLLWDRDKNTFIDPDSKEPVSGVGRKVGTKAAADDPNAAMPPETLQSLAEQYLAGDRTVMQNIGRGIQGSKNVVALRSEIAKLAGGRGLSGADIAAKLAEYDGMKAGMRTLGTRTANVEMAVTEAQQLAPLVLDASGKVNRTQFPLLNSALQAGEKGVGDEDVVRFGIAVNSLINTYARAINPTGVSRVSDIEHARELLSTAWSKGQINAGVDQLMKEMDAARRSPGAVREEMRGAISGRGAALPSTETSTPLPGGGASAAVPSAPAAARPAAPAKAAAPREMPVPPAFRDLPDGRPLLGPDGVTRWIKKGDKLIEMPAAGSAP